MSNFYNSLGGKANDLRLNYKQVSVIHCDDDITSIEVNYTITDTQARKLISKYYGDKINLYYVEHDIVLL